MAAEAGFGRDVPAPMSVEHDGYDTDAKSPNYQMIPRGGNRIWSVRTRGQVAVAVVNPSVAQVSLASSPNGAPIKRDQVLVFDDARPTVRDIRITAASVGRTQVVALDVSNNLRELAQIVISVKAESSFTYNLLRLRDLRRPPVRNQADLEIIASLVERVFFKQTNTRMARKDSKEIFVKTDLGDPINIETGASAAAFKLEAEVKKMEDDGRISRADRHIVSTWDIDTLRTQGFTPGFGNICMVQCLENGLDEVKSMAHELCHSFKVHHEYHESDGLLMSAAPTGMRMLGIDIDRINRSGTLW